jgi:hypothetical protein
MGKPAKGRIEAVFVQKTARWLRFPPDIRKAFNKGVERTKKMYLAIQSEAKAPNLPSVRILDVCWMSREMDGPILGCGPVLYKEGTEQTLGVELPATTVIFVDDETTLRRILVHEMAHFFYTIERVAEQKLAGRNELIVKSSKPRADTWEGREKADQEKHANPESWFGETDCRNFMADSHDPCLDRPIGRIRDEWIDRGLPYEVPTSGGESGGEAWGIPEGILEYAIQLRMKVRSK